MLYNQLGFSAVTSLLPYIISSNLYIYLQDVDYQVCTRIDVGNILQSSALGRVVEGDSDVEEGNDTGHARRPGIQASHEARLVDRYRYGMPRGLEQTSGVPISFVVGLP